MKKIGDHANAEKAAAEALELERAVAERPAAGPFEWNEYANGLVKADFASLKQPAKALDLALRAAHGTKESDPIILDTLGLGLLPEAAMLPRQFAPSARP